MCRPPCCPKICPQRGTQPRPQVSGWPQTNGREPRRMWASSEMRLALGVAWERAAAQRSRRNSSDASARFARARAALPRPMRISPPTALPPYRDIDSSRFLKRRAINSARTSAQPPQIWDAPPEVDLHRSATFDDMAQKLRHV